MSFIAYFAKVRWQLLLHLKGSVARLCFRRLGLDLAYKRRVEIVQGQWDLGIQIVRLVFLKFVRLH